MRVFGYKESVKGRKSHTCYLCGLAIPKGEPHLSWKCVDDGSFSSMRAHAACNAAAQEMLDDWTNGEGVELYALRSCVWDQVVFLGKDERYSIDEDALRLILESHQLQAIISDIRREVGEDNGRGVE